MSDDVREVRYPRQFEIFRLEALGEDPYLDIDDARRSYDDGRGLSVVSEGAPPSWFLDVSTKLYRFAVTFYAPTSAPIRTVTWEREGEGLLCRRVIDLFYPDGDPRRRVPFSQIVSVTQDLSADGVVGVTLASPIADDDFREVRGVEGDLYRAAVPAFGDWAPLLSASAPESLDRFGIDSIDEAIAYADRCSAQGANDSPSLPDGGSWRVPASDRDVMNAVDAVIADERPKADVPVLVRGAARILPLAVQADGGTQRDPSEERRRMTVLANRISDACEYREGRGIVLDLDRHGTDRVASYAAALRNARAAKATYWAYGPTRGVVLVWTGSELAGTLALALHIVPVSWVTESRSKAATEEIDISWSRADLEALRPNFD